MDSRQAENLSHDPIHGYIRFVAPVANTELEVCERDIIDHPWVQRMRQIRQLQTAWWVFPTAEHSRFQHILGVMHLASSAIDRLYDSLQAVDPTTPDKPVIELLMRMAGLLHDVGHGPFGHFFDAHFLRQYDLTHERLGGLIIEQELGTHLRQLGRAPSGPLPAGQSIDPQHIAWLIQRPTRLDDSQFPKWLHCLRSLFCGIYTIDNMDFVLRDAFMTGLSPRAFDLPRILHYSSFTKVGLTIHDRGMHALIHFLSMKAELFRSVYFHRTVRAIDLELAELFRISQRYIFPGDPREHLSEYQDLTEFSLLSDARRWCRSSDPELGAIGQRWKQWLSRKLQWAMVCQRNMSFGASQSESSSVFSSPRIFAESIRERLPTDLQDLPFQVDLARHIHRPHTVGATAGMNFIYDSASGRTLPLTAHGLYGRLPISHTIARVYAHDRTHASVFAHILDQLLGAPGEDDLTNM
ncbi:MAG: HD domain-containing protein [Pirellulaceae bacterium]